ncbi:phospholipase D family protein [Cellvibrio polysaccharolyticus]|uniref:DNA repair protein n=1 Tax=Cellvibrio polysaccharolyticus TaxID=2082724 RepID=A0A928YUK8_9GAMM|nr:phospholipase D family protein [Cellvibrio polysaccharolyticus]MBE8718796.1 DNA repair protein [Cellvibrio polysaccharolyticus]
MAKFLNTSATNYFLEELIKNARDRLILISPFLKLSDRIKELLEDKNRLKIDVRIVYGKSELLPEEINWLNNLSYIRTSFCKNLHAKCYLNEELCIVTSLNLYEFSQINNNEMGVLMTRTEDNEIFMEAYEEAQRIIRISEEVRVSLERVDQKNEPEENTKGKLTTSKLAKKLGKSTDELLEALVQKGHLKRYGDKVELTDSGKALGASHIKKSRFGSYFIWPEDCHLD